MTTIFIAILPLRRSVAELAIGLTSLTYFAGQSVKHLNCLQPGVARTVFPGTKIGARIPYSSLLAALPCGLVILRFVPASTITRAFLWSSSRNFSPLAWIPTGR
jgi:hypothetical protein